jgi:hypothetical protein
MTPDDIRKLATWLLLEIKVACVEPADLAKLDTASDALLACADVVEATQQWDATSESDAVLHDALARLEELKP